jgi:hypothetical protein
MSRHQPKDDDERNGQSDGPEKYRTHGRSSIFAWVKRIDPDSVPDLSEGAGINSGGEETAFACGTESIVT